MHTSVLLYRDLLVAWSLSGDQPVPEFPLHSHLPIISLKSEASRSRSIVPFCRHALSWKRLCRGRAGMWGALQRSPPVSTFSSNFIHLPREMCQVKSRVVPCPMPGSGSWSLGPSLSLAGDWHRQGRVWGLRMLWGRWAVSVVMSPFLLTHSSFCSPDKRNSPVMGSQNGLG